MEGAEPRTSLLPRWLGIVGGLATLACVVLLVAKMTIVKPRDIGSPNPPIAIVPPAPAPPILSTPTVTEIDPAKELAQLSQATDRLDADLKKLRQDALRRDARRQVAMTFEHFDKW
ncbi:MAG: hypothetical protein JWL69_3 [Phycisphaerales bacterium]|nr:hypothetical protein [Phycisphaerales bacterium]MDB5332210.1 hypothetical protein [Phycisphaerales bacterium]